VACCREPFQYAHRRVFMAPLQTTDMGSINPRIDGEALLRKSALDPQPSEISCYTRSSPHNES